MVYLWFSKRLMNMKFLIGIVALLILILAGCSTQTTVKYQCVDGSFVDSVNLCSSKTCPEANCPKLDCNACPVKTETKIETQTLTKYQCWDDTIKDNLKDCTTLEQRLTANPIVLEGSDNQVTDKFYLKKGLAIFKNKYVGQYNFIAYLIDSEGNNIGIVANTIGSSETSSSAKIDTAGYYRIEVTAWPGSDWTIRVEQ